MSLATLIFKASIQCNKGTMVLYTEVIYIIDVYKKGLTNIPKEPFSLVFQVLFTAPKNEWGDYLLDHMLHSLLLKSTVIVR